MEVFSNIDFSKIKECIILILNMCSAGMGSKF